MMSLVMLAKLVQMSFNLGLESTEVRLDLFGIFSGENAKGRSNSVLMREISNYELEIVEWKRHKFYNLIITKKNSEIVMFGIDELNLSRLRPQIENELTK